VTTRENITAALDVMAAAVKHIHPKPPSGIYALNVAANGDANWLAVEEKPLYEHREMWAEENAAISSNQPEYSYGNGATSYIGLPFDSGWEVIELGINADVFAASAIVTIDLMSYNTPSSDTSNTIDSFTIDSSADGGGTTNNAYKHHLVPTPVPVPAGLVGFLTRSVTGGTVSDVRVWARFRRQVGTYLAPVSP